MRHGQWSVAGGRTCGFWVLKQKVTTNPTEASSVELVDIALGQGLVQDTEASDSVFSRGCVVGWWLRMSGDVSPRSAA